MALRLLLFLLSTSTLLAQLPVVPVFNFPPKASGGGGATVVTNQNDIIWNLLGNSASTSQAATYTATLGQPSTNSLILAHVVNTAASAVPVPTSLSGNNVTWVLITDTNNPGATLTNMESVWRAQGANPTAGTLTVSIGGSPTGCSIQVVEGQGADATGANGANAIVTAYPTNGVSANPQVGINLSGGVKTNSVLLFLADNVNSATVRTAPTNFIPLVVDNYATPNCGAQTMLQGDCMTNVSLTVTATSRTWEMIAIEVKPGLEANPLSRPTLVQHRAWYNSNEFVNNFTNWLPNPTLAGNLIHIHIVSTFTGSRTLTITEDKGDNVTLAAETQAGGGPDMTLWDYYVTNCTAGAQKFVSIFNTNTLIFHIEISEFANVALSKPLETNGFTATITGPVTSGGLTTNNTDGDLVLSYVTDISGGGLETQDWKGALLGGGHWLSTQAGLGCASSYAVQAKAGPVDCYQQTIGNADSYVNEVFSYKRATAGTLPSTNSIHIIRIADDVFPGGTSATAFLPFDGNLQLFTCTFTRNTSGITSGTPDQPGTWTQISQTDTANNGQMFWSAGQTTRNNPPVYLKIAYASGNTALVQYWDIYNTNASPLDVEHESSGSTVANNVDVTSATAITPTTSNGLVINLCQFANGPEQCSLTAAHIFDNPYATSMTDASHLSHGDVVQHYFNPNTSAVSFGNHTDAGGTGTWFAFAVSFKY